MHIRELKRKLYKYMSGNETKRYIDVLGNLVNSLNVRYRCKIGTRPVDVSEDNSGKVLKRRYPQLFAGSRRYPLKYKFKLNDAVRISLHKEKLRHGYLPNFSEELYRVIKLVPYDPVRYKLASMENEVIEGLFYEEELIKATDLNKAEKA